MMTTGVLVHIDIKISRIQLHHFWQLWHFFEIRFLTFFWRQIHNAKLFDSQFLNQRRGNEDPGRKTTSKLHEKKRIRGEEELFPLSSNQCREKKEFLSKSFSPQPSGRKPESVIIPRSVFCHTGLGIANKCAPLVESVETLVSSNKIYVGDAH